MIRLAISVEGQTEEEFVNGVLAEHLRGLGVEPQPIKVGGRGGSVSVERLAPEMATLYWSFDFVTSLVDFYGFRRRGTGETVEQLETRINEEVRKAIGRSWDQSRAFAYVQRHEFEGLLFSDTGAFAELTEASADSIAALRAIRAGFPTPEDIDDGRETAPGRRITGLIPRYRKRLHGPLVAIATGLEKMRAECPRFAAWVTRLEALAEG